MSRMNSTNNWGLSEYIVAASATQGNYATIQSAINAINASVSKSGNIHIHPGSYTENLTIPSGTFINLVAASDEAIFTGLVALNGNVTSTGSSFFSFSNFQILGTVSATGGGQLALYGTQVLSSSGAAVTVSSTGLDAKFCYIQNGSGVALQNTNVGSTLQGCLFSGNINLVGSGTPIFNDCTFTTGIISASGASSSRFIFCDLTNSAANWNITTGCTLQAVNCIANSSNGSGFFVTGTGTFNHANVALTGTATSIDPGLTSNTYPVV